MYFVLGEVAHDGVRLAGALVVGGDVVAVPKAKRKRKKK